MQDYLVVWTWNTADGFDYHTAPAPTWELARKVAVGLQAAQPPDEVLIFFSSALSVENRFLESLEAYRSTGRPTGGFLQALLENNAYGAISRADGAAQYQVAPIMRWICQKLPSVAWGSPDAVKRWIAHRGLENTSAG